MSVGIVLVNYNGWRDTIQCLESLLPTMPRGTRVVVVDNASTDDSPGHLQDWLRRRIRNLELTFAIVDGASGRGAAIADIFLCPCSENGGFASGNNVGISLLESVVPCEWYWLLNNDTVVAADAVAQLISFARTTSAGIIGCTIAEFDDRSVVQCAGGAYYSDITTRNHFALRGKPVSNITGAPAPRINYISGAAMFIRADVFRRVGPLNEDYFLYYEEIDYARRAAAQAVTIDWCRESIVFHKGGASTNAPRGRRKSALAEYHANLSCLKYTRTFRPALFVPIATNRLLMKLVFLLGRREARLAKPLLKAYWDFLCATRQ